MGLWNSYWQLLRDARAWGYHLVHHRWQDFPAIEGVRTASVICGYCGKIKT